MHQWWHEICTQNISCPRGDSCLADVDIQRLFENRICRPHADIWSHPIHYLVNAEISDLTWPVIDCRQKHLWQSSVQDCRISQRSQWLDHHGEAYCIIWTHIRYSIPDFHVLLGVQWQYLRETWLWCNQIAVETTEPISGNKKRDPPYHSNVFTQTHEALVLSQ